MSFGVVALGAGVLQLVWRGWKPAAMTTEDYDRFRRVLGLFSVALGAVALIAGIVI